MKKLSGIIITSLILYFNPIAIEDTNAFFKNPQEKCVDRILDQWNSDNVVGASKFCAGANKYTLKCIDRILDQWNNNNVAGAAKFCGGSDNTTMKCIDKVLAKWNNKNVAGATKICIRQ